MGRWGGAVSDVLYCLSTTRLVSQFIFHSSVCLEARGANLQELHEADHTSVKETILQDVIFQFVSSKLPSM